ncbi:MAG: FKBP-type peptidyl-prolyl cis-trans isomerase [Deltaproteobacteria bacterium]|nr:FKBP-type peptidyl-prolyl cis-trans isomerase [Deltaproteobacteria bacterium]
MQQGLVTEVLKRGQGKEARSGDTVQVHYVGSFPDGRRFETSRDRGEPFRFQLGAGKVMRGWDEGIQGMKAGEVRKLTIPPSLAYGDSQVGAIPPNSTLVFELELVSVL